MVTIFVNKKTSEVGIVRWFRDPKFCTIHYPAAPLYRMTMEEFRLSGYEWLHRHFREAETKRINESEIKSVFDSTEAKRYLKNQLVVAVSNEGENTLTVNPMGFRRYDFGGFKDMGPETRKKIPANCPPEVFWETFDEVLAAATET